MVGEMADTTLVFFTSHLYVYLRKKCKETRDYLTCKQHFSASTCIDVLGWIGLCCWGGEERYEQKRGMLSCTWTDL